jgi:transcriptional regulator with XRE-family HTH domain
MQDSSLPQPIPGPRLAELRKSLGVKQIDLANRMGMHRVSLNGWERAAEVDPMRAARYQRALREIVAEAVGPEGLTA